MANNVAKRPVRTNQEDCVEGDEHVCPGCPQMIAYFQEDKGSSLGPETESRSGKLCSIISLPAPIRAHARPLIYAVSSRNRWSYICPTGVVSTLPLPQGININIGSPEIKIDAQATQYNSIAHAEDEATFNKVYKEKMNYFQSLQRESSKNEQLKSLNALIQAEQDKQKYIGNTCQWIATKTSRDVKKGTTCSDSCKDGLNLCDVHYCTTKKAKCHEYERAQADDVQESDNNGNMLEKSLASCIQILNSVPIPPKKLTVDNLPDVPNKKHCTARVNTI
ncbi:hypothetical protein PROFUN_15667 [Planoprotostelium fungivorum]|uniref:Uncharacterized protein n=1 Tax=Planoprotostelium fungivorum TaxID=1890364 RepID=A0A2P6MS63_9EUKA|nr:hypothetical protein PROFUN_15667 [Planoprotostelium fungivorum]